MNINDKNKSDKFLLIFMLIASICGGLFVCYIFYWADAINLKKIQSFKLKNGETLRSHVERLFPGGEWSGGELASTYEVGTNVFFWDIEDNRVLAASGATIEMFPEVAPQMDITTFGESNKDTLFDPFAFEFDYKRQYKEKEKNIK
jgi:hypothetical protein